MSRQLIPSRLFTQNPGVFRFCLVTMGAVALLSAGMVQAVVHTEGPGLQPGVPEELKEVGVTEHLGDQISLNQLTFKDETGKSVRFSEFFHRGKPVILNLVYYECPNLCNFVLNGLVRSLKSLTWSAGQQFEMVTVSIDSREKAELAAAKKAAYLKEYGRSGSASGWHFLTGDEAEIRKLAKEVGFGFRYDPKEKEFAHSAVTFVLTADGKVSRYLYGIEFPAKEMKLALLEASGGKIGTVIDRFVLFCYHYDPKSRKYSVYLTRLMQAGCAGTVVVLGGYLLVFWLRQRRLAGQEDTDNLRGFKLHV